MVYRIFKSRAGKLAVIMESRRRTFSTPKYILSKTKSGVIARNNGKPRMVCNGLWKRYCDSTVYLKRREAHLYMQGDEVVETKKIKFPFYTLFGQDGTPFIVDIKLLASNTDKSQVETRSNHPSRSLDSSQFIQLWSLTIIYRNRCLQRMHTQM